jgi:hypothetical protein
LPSYTHQLTASQVKDLHNHWVTGRLSGFVLGYRSDHETISERIEYKKRKTSGANSKGDGDPICFRETSITLCRVVVVIGVFACGALPYRHVTVDLVVPHKLRESIIHTIATIDSGGILDSWVLIIFAHLDMTTYLPNN